MQDDNITPDPAPAPKTVKVKALGHLHEGVHRNPGEVFEVTPERRAALGKQVEDVK
jgi:hypothetical protein